MTMTPDTEHDLKRGISKLSSAVSNLTVNVATQTEAIQGLKALYELKFDNIYREIALMNKLGEKVYEHDLYIAETEGKLEAIGTMIKAGWAVIGANVLAFGGFLIEMYIEYRAGK